MLKNHIDVSVVIPTIGEENLSKLIKDLLNGSRIPKEIILVYPPNYNFLKTKISNKVIMIKSKIKGQVFQRKYGIEKASYDTILQLDSDLTIFKNTLKELWDTHSFHGKKVAIGPRIIHSYDGVNIEKKQKKKWKNIFDILGGGNINVISNQKPFRFDSWYHDWLPPENSGFVNVLPGGCIMFDKTYYINFDYYPFEGKATGEDLLNSVYFREYGFKLYVNIKAKIIHPGFNEYTHFRLKDLCHYLVKVYKIKFKVCNIASGNFVRLHLWFFYYTLGQIIKFFFSNKEYEQEG